MPVSAMSQGKTLVAYASKTGANKEAGEVIADTLRSAYAFEVETADLKEGMPDISPYENIIVGSGVRAGRVYGEAVEFLGRDFGQRKVALYFCCMEGGDTKAMGQVPSKYGPKLLEKNPGLKPIDIGAFGGCMKVLGRVVTDTRDPERVKAWALELGKKLQA